MQTALKEIARAKINLTLRVLGRRADGYHELDSLVAFADFGDVLHMLPGNVFSLAVDGPFANAIDGENLIEKAVAAVKAAVPATRAGAVQLTKILPVAAGIGGGSADAAAMLRLLARANPGLADTLHVTRLTLALGADVPVCLGGRAARMTGVGETVEPIDGLPEIAAVLANPGVPLRTSDVFGALSAPATGRAVAEAIPDIRKIDELHSYLATHPNDLERTARKLCPPVAALLDAMTMLPGAKLVRMSGSGPTCFALFSTPAEAQLAASMLKRRWPSLWSVATRLT